MKIIVYVDGAATADQLKFAAELRTRAKVTVANGNAREDFKTVCDVVYADQEYQHLIDWCHKDGIEFKMIPSVSKPEEAAEPEPEPEPARPRRGRRKAEPEPEPETPDETDYTEE